MKIQTSLMLMALSFALLSGCTDQGRGQSANNDGDPGVDAGPVEPDGGPDVDAADAMTAEDAQDEDAGDDPIDLTLIEADEALASVDVFVGTGGYGFGFSGLTPAAQVPHGLVKLGPDTTYQGVHPRQSHFGGYNFYDADVRGFSHLHFVGTGAADYGNLRVLPMAAALPAEHPEALHQPLDKDSEAAGPGFYSATIGGPEERVEVALTATVRGGLHQYRFPAGRPATILIDPTASVLDNGALDAEWVATETGFEGWLTYRGGFVGRTQPFTLFFSATVDPPPDRTHVWQDEGWVEGQSLRAARNAAALSWDEAPAQGVTMRLGVSLVDGDQATLHREVELEGRSYEEVVAAAQEAWKARLGRVRIAGVSAQRRRAFYTALYNAHRMPTRFEGADGRYRGMDNEIHELAPGQQWFLSDLSLWDSFRTTHPWYALVHPDVQVESLRSLMDMARQRGRVPRWPAALSFTGSMIGSCADQIFAESALKGLEGVDYDEAFDLLLASNFALVRDDLEGETGRDGVEDYVTLGYLPHDRHEESVSKTTEYALSDAALALMATHLERPEAQWLSEYGDHWRNLYDEETGFLLPRLANGDTVEITNKESVGMRDGPYTEGSAWHWRFYVPHDGAGLAEALGGPDKLAEALEAYFEGSAYATDRLNTALPDGMYWHGNQPPLHTVFFYHDAGRPDRLSHWIRRIQLMAYSDQVDGLAGNDDGGTLSTWYAFSALGFFPIVGTDQYYLSAPLVPLAEIDLGDGEVLRVEAPGAHEDVYAFGEVTLDGAPVTQGRVRHEALRGGVTLRFEPDAASP